MRAEAATRASSIGVARAVALSSSKQLLNASDEMAQFEPNLAEEDPVGARLDTDKPAQLPQRSKCNVRDSASDTPQLNQGLNLPGSMCAGMALTEPRRPQNMRR